MARVAMFPVSMPPSLAVHESSGVSPGVPSSTNRLRKNAESSYDLTPASLFLSTPGGLLSITESDVTTVRQPIAQRRSGQCDDQVSQARGPCDEAAICPASGRISGSEFSDLGTQALVHRRHLNWPRELRSQRDTHRFVLAISAGSIASIPGHSIRL
jgi:hypothetical protein